MRLVAGVVLGILGIFLLAGSVGMLLDIFGLWP